MDAPKERQAKIVDKPFQLVLPPVATGGASLMMVGSTRSGKTTALKHILDKYFPKHLGCLFSQSVKADAYKDMNYPLLVKSTPYIPELIHDAYVINKETKNHYPWLFIIDDHPLVKTDKELLKLCTIYRNSGISSITCCQNLGMINPTCRSNINFVLLFHLNNTEAIEKTIKVFLRGYLPASWNYDKKIEWYSQTTKDHHFLLINNLEGTICRCKIQI